MQISVAVLFLRVAFEVWAECGKLCDFDWWKNAKPTVLLAELTAGADAKALADPNGSTRYPYTVALGCSGQNPGKYPSFSVR